MLLTQFRGGTCCCYADVVSVQVDGAVELELALCAGDLCTQKKFRVLPTLEVCEGWADSAGHGDGEATLMTAKLVCTCIVSARAHVYIHVQFKITRLGFCRLWSLTKKVLIGFLLGWFFLQMK